MASNEPAPTRTARRAAVTRQAVVDAAREIVAARGPAALSIEEVADRADVAVATIYNRVGGRSALLVAVAEEAMEEGRARMDLAYAAAGTPEERLLGVARAWVDLARARPHEFRMLAEPADEPEAVERLARLTRAQNAKLADLLREAVAAGAGRADLDPDDVATTLWAALNGVLALAWRPGDLRATREEVDRYVATFVAMAAGGLLPA